MPTPTARADKGDVIWGLIAEAAQRFEEDSNDCPAEDEVALIDGFIFWKDFSPVPGATRLLDGGTNEEPGKEEFPAVEGFIIPSDAFCGVDSSVVACAPGTTQIPPG